MNVVPQCPPVPAPSMASGLLDSWLDGYRRFWELSLDRLERELRKRPR